jgi:predicted unusual protein kinase regulating ubiquinone biosynthesis (AarF/ABC1/UbiB family)
MQFGVMAGELAAGGLVEGVRRLASEGSTNLTTAFLSEANANKLARRLSRMRGAAMKLGQLISLQGEDLLPPEFAQTLAVLRSAADRMPVAQLERALEREYGRGWATRFAEFDFEPLAAASIGQVHYARTSDGRELALKIQYPGVTGSIDSDVDNAAFFLRTAKLLPAELDFSSILEEAKHQLHREADYLREAGCLRRYRELVADEPRFSVPRVHSDLTTTRILAMEFLRGRPIEELDATHIPQAKRDRVGSLLLHLLLRELFEFRLVQTDPNFANYLYDAQTDRIVLLDFGSTLEYAPEFISRYSRMGRAIINGNKSEARDAAIDIGYLRHGDSELHTRGVLDLITLGGEPIRHLGRYDFGRSRLAVRARDEGFDLAFRRGFLRTPPPETVFLHRKLVGSFLLCARIGARVDVRSLLLPFL